MVHTIENLLDRHIKVYNNDILFLVKASTCIHPCCDFGAAYELYERVSEYIIDQHTKKMDATREDNYRQNWHKNKHNYELIISITFFYFHNILTNKILTRSQICIFYRKCLVIYHALFEQQKQLTIFVIDLLRLYMYI